MPTSATPSAISPTISSESRSSRSTLTCGCAGEEGAQRLGQEFEQRVGVRQHPDLAGAPARIGGELVAQPLDLGQDRAGVLEKRASGRGRRHALAAAGQERRSERLLHVPDAGRGGGEREMRPLGAAGDRARLDDLAEETEIGEVEVHG